MNPFEALELMNALKRNQTTHKGDCGKVLLVGGAVGMAGTADFNGQGMSRWRCGFVPFDGFDLASAHLISD